MSLIHYDRSSFFRHFLFFFVLYRKWCEAQICNILKLIDFLHLLELLKLGVKRLDLERFNMQRYQPPFCFKDASKDISNYNSCICLVDGGKLTPTKSADKQGNDPPPESARTEFTEDETPRATFINNCCRLLLLSDKTPKSYRVAECCLPDVVLVHYKNDSSVLSDLLRDAVYKCGDKRVLSVAFMCHSQDSMIHLCSSVEKV